MTESRLEIFSINFDVDAVMVAYMRAPEDVRVDGQVALQHTARLDLGHADYAEDAETLRRLAQRMLSNALQDFHDSEPWTPEPEDDDDEVGMGDGR